MLWRYSWLLPVFLVGQWGGRKPLLFLSCSLLSHLTKAVLPTHSHTQTPSNKFFKFLGMSLNSRRVKSKSPEVEARSAGVSNIIASAQKQAEPKWPDYKTWKGSISNPDLKFPGWSLAKIIMIKINMGKATSKLSLLHQVVSIYYESFSETPVWDWNGLHYKRQINKRQTLLTCV